MPNVAAYIAVILIAALVTGIMTRPAARVARRVDYTDAPGGRKVHDIVTPYGGGAAMFIGLCATVAIAPIFPALRPVITVDHEVLGILLAAGIIFLVGVIDDYRQMSAPAKTAGQVLAASVLYFSGATMVDFKVPFGGFIIIGSSLLPIVTAAWVFALSNAINLIDGLDGLAGGIVAIASGTLFIYGLRLEALGLLPATNPGPLIAAATCGICLGFLPDNFHPARLFMGDAGALMLGLLMSASTMVIGGRTAPASGVTFFFFAPVLIPFFILGIPLFDAAFAFIRRTAKGQGFHAPDKDHIHHRLLRLGHGPRRTVVILWSWTALLCGFVLYPLFRPRANALVPFGVLALGVGLYTWFHPGLRQSDPDDELEGPPNGGVRAGVKES